MFEVHQSDAFAKWFEGLKDRKAAVRIQVRIDRVQYQGHFGDCASVGEGVSELRIHYGPGYRVYFKRSGRTVVVLLVGGDKSTQQADIARAIKIAVDWKE